MLPATTDEAAFLDSTTQCPLFVLLTIAPVVGAVNRWTDCDVDLVVGGLTYTAAGTGTVPLFEPPEWSVGLGLEVRTASLRLLCGEVAAINGIRLPLAAVDGLLEDAEVTIQITAMPTPGTLAYTFTAFVGTVADVRPSSTELDLTLENGFAQLLRVKLPRVVCQPACTNTLGDSICGVNLAAVTATGTVAAGSTNKVVRSNLTAPAIGYYALGVMTFTSGALAGVRRTVVSYVSWPNGEFVIDRPLPSVPAAGDQFTVYPGCNKMKADPGGCPKHGGPAATEARFRGFPYVPKTEAGGL